MRMCKPTWVTHGTGKPIFSLHVHPDGSRLATGGQGDECGKVVIWNMKPIRCSDAELDRNIPKILCSMDNHLACVNCVRWSGDGRFLCSAGDDHLIMVWRRNHGHKATAVVSTAFSGAGGGGVEQWKLACTLTAHQGDVLGLAWSPGDTYLASCSIDNTVIIWNAQKFPEQITVLKGHSGMVKGIVWDPIGKYLASQSDDKTLCIWRTLDWKEEKKISKSFKQCAGTTHVLRLDWSPDGQYVVTTHSKNNTAPTAAIVERSSNWNASKDFVGHQKSITVAKFNPSLFSKSSSSSKKKHHHCCIAIGSRDCTLSIWLTSLKRPRIVLHKVFINSILDITWYETELLCCSSDGTCAYLSFDKVELGERLDTVAMVMGQSTNAYNQKTYGQKIANGGKRLHESVQSHCRQFKKSKVIQPATEKPIPEPLTKSATKPADKGTPKTHPPPASDSTPTNSDPHVFTTPICRALIPAKPKVTNVPKPLQSNSSTTKPVNVHQNPSLPPAIRSNTQSNCSSQFSNKQIEIIQTNGKRRITPIFIPQDNDDSQHSMPMQSTSNAPTFSSTKAQSSIVVERMSTEQAKALSSANHKGFHQITLNATSRLAAPTVLAVCTSSIPPIKPVVKKGLIASSQSLAHKKALIGKEKSSYTHKPPTAPPIHPTSQAPPQLNIPVKQTPTQKSQSNPKVQSNTNFMTKQRFSIPTLSQKDLIPVKGDPSRSFKFADLKHDGLYTLSHFYNGNVKWVNTYSSRLISCESTPIYTLLSLLDRSLLLLSTKSGAKQWPTLILDSTMHKCILLKKSYIIVITSMGSLYIWELKSKKRLFKGVNINEIIPDPTTILVTTCDVTDDGDLIVILNNGKSFMYSLDFSSWILLVDVAHPINEHNEISVSQKHQGPALNLRNLTRTCYARHLLKTKKVVRKVSSIVSTSATLGFIEEQLLNCEILHDRTAYKHWLMTYVTYLSRQLMEDGLREVTDKLIGPLITSRTNEMWDSMILGNDKHSLAEEILVLVADNPNLQRFYTEASHGLDLARKRLADDNNCSSAPPSFRSTSGRRVADALVLQALVDTHLKHLAPNSRARARLEADRRRICGNASRENTEAASASMVSRSNKLSISSECSFSDELDTTKNKDLSKDEFENFNNSSNSAYNSKCAIGPISKNVEKEVIGSNVELLSNKLNTSLNGSGNSESVHLKNNDTESKVCQPSNNIELMDVDDTSIIGGAENDPMKETLVGESSKSVKINNIISCDEKEDINILQNGDHQENYNKKELSSNKKHLELSHVSKVNESFVSSIDAYCVAYDENKEAESDLENEYGTDNENGEEDSFSLVRKHERKLKCKYTAYNKYSDNEDMRDSDSDADSKDHTNSTNKDPNNSNEISDIEEISEEETNIEDIKLIDTCLAVDENHSNSSNGLLNENDIVASESGDFSSEEITGEDKLATSLHMRNDNTDCDDDESIDDDSDDNDLDSSMVRGDKESISDHGNDESDHFEETFDNEDTSNIENDIETSDDIENSDDIEDVVENTDYLKNSNNIDSVNIDDSEYSKNINNANKDSDNIKEDDSIEDGEYESNDSFEDLEDADNIEDIENNDSVQYTENTENMDTIGDEEKANNEKDCEVINQSIESYNTEVYVAEYPADDISSLHPIDSSSPCRKQSVSRKSYGDADEIGDSNESDNPNATDVSMANDLQTDNSSVTQVMEDCNATLDSDASVESKSCNTTHSYINSKEVPDSN